MTNVILVDTADREMGVMEKMTAHQQGILHRAFSVFLFNDKNELLLQRRALSKYHSGGLWTNTCCSHPMPGENIKNACHRRLREEMGMDADLHFVTSFIYRAELDNNLIEHEFDHVFMGITNEQAIPNPEEVEEWKYISLDQLEYEMQIKPESFTVWFRMIYHNVKDFLIKYQST